MTKIEINLDGDQGNRTFIMAMVKAYLDSIGKISRYESYLDEAFERDSIISKNYSGYDKKLDTFIRVSLKYCPIMIIRRV